MQTFNNPSSLMARFLNIASKINRTRNSLKEINQFTDWEGHKNQWTKTTAADLTQPEGPEKSVAWSNLIGQEPCDVQIWIA